MKLFHLSALSLVLFSSAVVAQNAVPAKCPCDFSEKAFNQMLGSFAGGSVNCQVQSGVNVMTIDGKQAVVNTLSTRVIVLNKQSFTPSGWLLEYYSSEYAPPMGLGSYCADSMMAALKTEDRKKITKFSTYKACLSDIDKALQGVNVYCNQAVANFPDMPSNPKTAPISAPSTLQDYMKALPLKSMPVPKQ